MSVCKPCGNTFAECECISHEAKIQEATKECQRRHKDDSIRFGDRRWSAEIILIMLEDQYVTRN